jgi:hypothetical protein
MARPLPPLRENATHQIGAREAQQQKPHLIQSECPFLLRLFREHTAAQRARRTPHPHLSPRHCVNRTPLTAPRPPKSAFFPPLFVPPKTAAGMVPRPLFPRSYSRPNSQPWNLIVVSARPVQFPPPPPPNSPPCAAAAIPPPTPLLSSLRPPTPRHILSSAPVSLRLIPPPTPPSYQPPPTTTSAFLGTLSLFVIFPFYMCASVPFACSYSLFSEYELNAPGKPAVPLFQNPHARAPPPPNSRSETLSSAERYRQTERERGAQKTQAHPGLCSLDDGKRNRAPSPLHPPPAKQDLVDVPLSRLCPSSTCFLCRRVCLRNNQKE